MGNRWAHITPEERFWAKVNKTTTCWLWTGSLTKPAPIGYGRFHFNGRLILSHVYSYELHVGVVPSDMKVLHTCDTPACVNPDHLFLGTQQVNVLDMTTKGRGVCLRGSAHLKAKLNEEIVRQARERHSKGEPIAVMAREFGVSHPAMRNACLGKTWRSVPMLEGVAS